MAAREGAYLSRAARSLLADLLAPTPGGQPGD
jgi:hypothetical protein